jgi:hypothetical protein
MASLMSQSNSDAELLKLTRQLFEHAGRATMVKSGSKMFEVDEG